MGRWWVVLLLLLSTAWPIEAAREAAVDERHVCVPVISYADGAVLSVGPEVMAIVSLGHSNLTLTFSAPQLRRPEETSVRFHPAVRTTNAGATIALSTCAGLPSAASKPSSVFHLAIVRGSGQLALVPEDVLRHTAGAFATDFRFVPHKWLPGVHSLESIVRPSHFREPTKFVAAQRRRAVMMESDLSPSFHEAASWAIGSIPRPLAPDDKAVQVVSASILPHTSSSRRVSSVATSTDCNDWSLSVRTSQAVYVTGISATHHVRRDAFSGEAASSSYRLGEWVSALQPMLLDDLEPRVQNTFTGGRRDSANHQSVEQPLLNAGCTLDESEDEDEDEDAGEEAPNEKREAGAEAARVTCTVVFQQPVLVEDVLQLKIAQHTVKRVCVSPLSGVQLVAHEDAVQLSVMQELMWTERATNRGTAHSSSRLSARYQVVLPKWHGRADQQRRTASSPPPPLHLHPHAPSPQVQPDGQQPQAGQEQASRVQQLKHFRQAQDADNNRKQDKKPAGVAALPATLQQQLVSQTTQHRVGPKRHALSTDGGGRAAATASTTETPARSNVCQHTLFESCAGVAGLYDCMSAAKRSWDSRSHVRRGICQCLARAIACYGPRTHAGCPGLDVLMHQFVDEECPAPWEVVSEGTTGGIMQAHVWSMIFGRTSDADTVAGAPILPYDDLAHVVRDAGRVMMAWWEEQKQAMREHNAASVSASASAATTTVTTTTASATTTNSAIAAPVQAKAPSSAAPPLSTDKPSPQTDAQAGDPAGGAQQVPVPDGDAEPRSAETTTHPQAHRATTSLPHHDVDGDQQIEQQRVPRQRASVTSTKARRAQSK